MRKIGDDSFIYSVKDTDPETIQPSAGVLAILHEVEALLEVLLASGEPNAINLCGLPLRRSDRGVLKKILGRGHASGTVESAGTTRLWETRVAGVWWLEHHNRKGEILGEVIEIADIPDSLVMDTKVIRKDLARLHQWLSQANQTPGD